MLIIGHHVLYGKIVNLDKPLLVVKKEKNFSQIEKIDVMEEDAIENEDTKNIVTANTEYMVQAIIRKKILFNKRPRPIVHCLDNKKK